jgi:hypothetical protein
MWGIRLVVVLGEVVVREEAIGVEVHPARVVHTHLAVDRIHRPVADHTPRFVVVDRIHCPVADRIPRSVADCTHPMVPVVHNFLPPPMEKQF